MARARCTFKQTDVKRAVKAVVSAGLPVHEVKISAQGDIAVVTIKPEGQDSDAGARGNEWDRI
jgi:hypothetical protein